MVANAGHQVPYDTPRPALELYAWFVNRSIPPDTYPYPSEVVNNTIYVNETIYVNKTDTVYVGSSSSDNTLSDDDINGIVFGTTAAVLLLMYLTYLWTRQHVVHLMKIEYEDDNRSNVIGASFNTQTTNPLI